MKDKLAEEILNDTTYAGAYDNIERDELIKAMQAYHEDKLKEVTDEDIEEYASAIVSPESKKDFERGEWYGLKYGAIAMRDGEIKHNQR